MKKTVFDCQMCGQCCEGEGGIVLSPKDLKRLYEGLNLEKVNPVTILFLISASK